MIHIEGMGWLGAATAHTLHAAGIDFTWNDTDAPHVAWRACTGAVFPAGDDRSITNLYRWAHYTTVMPPGTVSRATYAYAHKAPPHHGRYTIRADLGWVRVADAPCYAVDVPQIVIAARTRYAALRRPAAPHGAHVIAAHGHTTRRGSWVWGWSAPVQLAISDDLTALSPDRPVILYGRAHRFAITYAYPIPSRPGWWWAGSSLMNQRTARNLDPEAHFTAWREHFAQLYPPVTILDRGPAIPGWRPKPRTGDTGDVEVSGGRLTMPPLWHSGVRWAPTLLDKALMWATVATGHHPQAAR